MIKKISIILISLCLLGCQSPIYSFNLSSEVRMDLYEAKVHKDGYTVKVKFIPLNSNFDSVVQELVVEDSEISLIEAFRKNIFSRDVHSTRDSRVFDEKRSMKVYLGDVRRADWDIYSFCQLPYNNNRTFHTKINKGWNVRYNKDHKTTGYVSDESKVYGKWFISYSGRKKNVKVYTDSQMYESSYEE